MLEPSEDPQEIDRRTDPRNRSEKNERKLGKSEPPKHPDGGSCFNMSSFVRMNGRFMNEKTPPRDKNPSGFAPPGETYGRGREYNQKV